MANPQTWVRLVLDAASEGQVELPTFPTVAIRLIELLENGDPSLRDVERLIAQDAVLAERVLRIANSVMYARQMPAETLAQALVRLGLRETAQVAMASAASVLFNAESRAELAEYPDLWHSLWFDSLVSAYGARLLSQDLKIANPEHVFLGAMFRNLGCVIILKVVSQALVAGSVDARPEADALCFVFAQVKGVLGAEYLERSRMPDYVVDIARHYADADAPASGSESLHVVRLAAGLCEKLDIAPFSNGELGELAQASIAELAVEQEKLELFELQFAQLAEQVAGLA